MGKSFHFSDEEIGRILGQVETPNWLYDKIVSNLQEERSNAKTSSMSSGGFSAYDPNRLQDNIDALNRVASTAYSTEGLKPNECAWEIYGYHCRQETSKTSDLQLCEEHLNKKCAKCGIQAIRGCPKEMQFVCGEPLCFECFH